MLLFEHRTLLDVHLERGLDGLARQRRRAYPKPLELAAHAHALAIGQGVGLIQRQAAGPDRRAHHRHGEAAALLVAPDTEFDGMARHHAVLVQGLDHFEAREHAVHAVELAPRRLRVQVAAGHDHRQVLIGALAPQEQVANGIEAHLATGGLRPAREQRPSLQVEIGQCLSVAPAVGRGADPAHLHEPRPEPLAVDAQGRGTQTPPQCRAAAIKASTSCSLVI